jgi:hypothetical protein
METNRERLFVILLIGICLPIGVFIVGCGGISQQTKRPEVLNSIKETDSLLFGYINPSVLRYVIHKGRVVEERTAHFGGLVGVLGASESKLVLSFKNRDTGRIDTTNVPGYGSKMQDFLIILPKGSYSLSISAPLLKNIVTAPEMVISHGGGGAIYMGELDLLISQQDPYKVLLRCELDKFKEKKEEFLKKYAQFMGKVVIGNQIGEPFLGIILPQSK